MEDGAPLSEALSEAVGELQSHTVDLETGRTYLMWVTAVDKDGAESAPSAAKAITPMAAGGGNNPPHITTGPVTQAEVSVVYAYDADATDADGDILTYALVTGPDGMTVDNSTGAVSWVPAADQRGVHDVELGASDGNSGTDTQGFRITVAAAPLPDDDGDGLDALAEVEHRSDPALWDTDGDGLSDGEEVDVYHTDPTLRDTDGDGTDDGVEVAAGTDPLTSRTTRLGSLKVTLEPAEALDAGAQWRVDNGIWRYNREQLDDLVEGAHTVSYSSLDGYVTPEPETVTIVYSQTTEIVLEYEAVPALFGDVNGDDRVDALDVQLVINGALGLAVGDECDINEDDRVDALDVQLVINAALGLISAL